MLVVGADAFEAGAGPVFASSLVSALLPVFVPVADAAAFFVAAGVGTAGAAGEVLAVSGEASGEAAGTGNGVDAGAAVFWSAAIVALSLDAATAAAPLRYVRHAYQPPAARAATTTATATNIPMPLLLGLGWGSGCVATAGVAIAGVATEGGAGFAAMVGAEAIAEDMAVAPIVAPGSPPALAGEAVDMAP